MARHICELPSCTAPIRGAVLFCHRRIDIVEMAICKIDSSFPLQQRQLLQAGSLPLKPPHTICSSTDSVTATRRLRLREVRWANLGAMHCQSRPRLQVARQVDLGRFLARLDRFPLGPAGCCITHSGSEMRLSRTGAISHHSYVARRASAGQLAVSWRDFLGPSRTMAQSSRHPPCPDGYNTSWQYDITRDPRGSRCQKTQKAPDARERGPMPARAAALLQLSNSDCTQGI